MFVDGARYEVVASAAARGRGQGGGAAAQIAGTWDMTTTTPQGVNTGTMTVTQDGSGFSGTMSGQFGSTQVEGGQITGRKATWTISLTFGGQSMLISYEAELDGNRMTGTATTPMGAATFTGEKRP